MTIATRILIDLAIAAALFAAGAYAMHWIDAKTIDRINASHAAEIAQINAANATQVAQLSQQVLQEQQAKIIATKQLTEKYDVDTTKTDATHAAIASRVRKPRAAAANHPGRVPETGSGGRAPPVAPAAIQLSAASRSDLEQVSYECDKLADNYRLAYSYLAVLDPMKAAYLPAPDVAPAERLVVLTDDAILAPILLETPNDRNADSNPASDLPRVLVVQHPDPDSAPATADHSDSRAGDLPGTDLRVADDSHASVTLEQESGL
jgi:hypothetical protein